MNNLNARYLGIVPARAGSVRVPGKNVRSFAGTSLIEIALSQSCGSKRLARVLISSNDEKCISVAESIGINIEYRRPNDLSTAESTSADTVIDVLDWLERRGELDFNYVVLLQPTSPFRTAAHIDAAISVFEASGASSLVSVTPAAPDAAFILNHDADGLLPVNGGGRIFVLDGSIFISPVRMIREKRRFWDKDAVPFEIAYPRFFDVDVETEFEMAECLAEAGLEVAKISPLGNE